MATRGKQARILAFGLAFALVGCGQTVSDGSAAIMIIQAAPKIGIVVDWPEQGGEAEEAERWVQVLELLQELNDKVPEPEPIPDDPVSIDGGPT